MVLITNIFASNQVYHKATTETEMSLCCLFWILTTFGPTSHAFSIVRGIHHSPMDSAHEYEVMRSFVRCFIVKPNTLLNKQSSYQCFGDTMTLMWRHCNVFDKPMESIPTSLYLLFSCFLTVYRRYLYFSLYLLSPFFSFPSLYIFFLLM